MSQVAEIRSWPNSRPDGLWTGARQWARGPVAGLALLTLSSVACAPKTPAELVQAGRLLDACELADYDYPEKSRATRAAIRQESDLRVELELLDADRITALVGAPVREHVVVMRQQLVRRPTRVTTDLVVEELRLSGVRYRPFDLSEGMAVELLAGPDPRDAPDGMLEELFVLTLVFAVTPLCVFQSDRPCEPSKLKLPAHEELARRNRERLEQLNADPKLRRAKERLLQLFHRPALPGQDHGSAEGYALLLPNPPRAPKGPPRITFVARHTITDAAERCSLIDRFTVEATDLKRLFASGPRLAELPVREITIWPDEHESPLP